MKRNSLLLPTLSLFLGLSMSAFAADAKLSSGDESFIKKAAADGMAEVKMGELASTKAKRADVKEFGAQMVKDHSAANTELKAVATAKGVQLPETLDKKHTSTVEKLSKLEGDAFDGAYVKQMVQDHESDVKDFEKEGSTGTDTEVKAFVAKTLPVLKQHLEHIKTIAGKK